MQAVILAAGKSSRFYPLSNSLHKSMIFLMGKPILEYTLKALKNAGIEDVILVVNSKNTIPSYFGNGKKLGVSLTYVVQKKPLGMGDGLLLAEKQIKDDFLLLHAHHLDIDIFARRLIDAKSQTVNGILLARKREDTWNQGVLRVKNNKVEEVVEKPEKGKEPSKLCIAGVYLFDRLFLKILSITSPEHYQLEQAITTFAQSNNLTFIETKEETVSLKYPWDLLTIKNYLLKNIKKRIGKNVTIAKSAEIIGEVLLENNVVIKEGARIKGPCYIGKDVFIGTNAIIRDMVDVEEGSVIGAQMEVKNSLIQNHTQTHSGFIGDSIIGRNCKIAAQFCTANVRLDRGKVTCTIKNEKVNTGLTHLGAIVGDNVKIGIKSSTMPGVIIGDNSIVGSSTTVLRNISDNTRYYTKFQEIMEEKKHE